MSKKAKEGVLQFTSFMDELFENLEIHSKQSEQKKKTENEDSKKSVKQTLAEFVEIIMNKSGLLELHKAQDEIAGTQKANNMQELVNSAVLYEYSRKGLLEFLDHIELDRTLENESEVNSDCVTLITLHNTKGLEFPRVVITGLESGIFPRQDKSGADLEEERRLFYVGITRAKDELYITSCHQRRLYGRSEFMEPSPFLFEAGDKPFRVLGEKPLSYQYQVEGKEEITGGFEAEADENKSKWSVGTRIFHDDYGYGQIVRSKIEEGELVISVLFENGGTKRFLPEFQKSSLTIIKD